MNRIEFPLLTDKEINRFEDLSDCTVIVQSQFGNKIVLTVSGDIDEEVLKEFGGSIIK